MKISLTTFFFALFAFVSLRAQPEGELPSEITVEEIIATYLENIGGAENWLRVKSVTFAGTALQGGMPFPTTVYSMYPDKSKVVADAMEKQYIECTNGDEGWVLNPFAGMTEPQKKTEQQMEMADAEFENPFINYREKGSVVELMGVEEIEGIPAYKVKLKKANGKEYFYFFDMKYFVPIMMRTYITSGDKEGATVDIYFSDYEEVEGLVIAHSIEQRFNGQVFLQMTADTIILNDPAVTAEMFEFPGKDKKD